MAKVTFIEHGGAEHTVDAETGASLMMAALNNDVPGIDADCGGECSCATCHVFVDDAWWDTTGGPGDMEEAMLDLSPERQAHSRLSCQIEVSDALDGLIVRLPSEQL